METKPVIILPFDGFSNPSELIRSATKFFESDLAKKLVAFVKLNDALHFPGLGPDILTLVQEVVPPEVKTFIDLKIADVSETDKNTLRRYASYDPAIVTVTSTVSAKSLLAIHEVLPDTKIALVDTLTDIPEKEIMKRYGMSAFHKIYNALNFFICELGGENPINMVVSSPKEVGDLARIFNYGFIVPGIRSPHMAKDHQERTTSAYEALKNGASFIVMGTQITKGNPGKGINPEESQRITFEEIEKYFSEK